MAKELPYFRFTVAEWLTDDISVESYELKGLFIDICAYYWFKDCSITLAMLYKKFSNENNILNLIELGIIKHESKHDKIKIDFLLTQYDLLSEKRKLRQSAGSKGGNAKAMLKQKGSYKDKDNNKDNIIKKDKKISFNDCLIFDKIEFKKEFPDWNIKKLQYYYEAGLSYSNEGNKYIDWKSAISNWAKRDELQGKIKFITNINNSDTDGLL